MWPWRGNLLYYLPFLICGMGVITWILPWQGLKWNNYNPKHPKNTQQQGRSVYCGARDFSKHFTSVNLFNVYKQIDTQCIYYYYSIMFHTRVQVLNFSLSTASQVVLVVKNPPANAGDKELWVQSLGQEGALEGGMATHSSIFSWRMLWTEEPGGLRSIGSQRARREWVTEHARTHSINGQHSSNYEKQQVLGQGSEIIIRKFSHCCRVTLELSGHCWNCSKCLLTSRDEP